MTGDFTVLQMQRRTAVAAQVLNVYGRRIAAEVAATVKPHAVHRHHMQRYRRAGRSRASSASSRPAAAQPLSSRGGGRGDPWLLGSLSCSTTGCTDGLSFACSRNRALIAYFVVARRGTPPLAPCILLAPLAEAGAG